jgi:hypothetical protein
MFIERFSAVTVISSRVNSPPPEASYSWALKDKGPQKTRPNAINRNNNSINKSL